ncbi:hypothetical protein JDV02_010535 [Purpureocillium takamizusanense]|uniref:Major facilitator superfamily (MFS) profile domain-containing protein n=1 Tax=Purpureocillium takamizusanense TaxID=2060973 RepID=A0A9Q8VFA3_9HYPO|nr:uncharacterized protein JDV02_010535 [Purpureocillium takamizusanense]UNI24815.1 hypothetical protein JDV02_010535 [Purpureocillium takamizusanense]
MVDEGDAKNSLDGDVEKQAVAARTSADREGNDNGVDDGPLGAVHVDEASEEENTVWWDGEDDLANPYNWPRWVKVFNCVLISSLTFVTPLASSMFAPGVPQLMAEFQSTSSELASFCVSVYVLGYATGPMLFAPLSELYGRVIVYHGCNVGFVAFLIACAKAPSLSALIAFRFLSGVFGSAPITNGGGTIADMIVQEKRGAAMASFAIGPLLGPIIGPVVGGVVADALGWRWVFWIIAIIATVLALVFLAFGRETYAPVILERHAARLRKETGNPRLRSKLDPGLSPADYFRRGILRPFKMLALSPVCIICNIYVGIAYAYLYLMFTSLTPLFMRIYGFNTVHAGLVFLGLGVGSLLGVAYFSVSSDAYMKKRAARDAAAVAAAAAAAAATTTTTAAPTPATDETRSAAVAVTTPPAGTASQLREPGIKPEYRLPPLKIGAFLLPAGLFIYGWTAEHHVHWIAPIIGTAVIGVGNLVIFMSLQMYLVDSFTLYAASALAANAVVRSVAGAVLPLAGLPMYDRLGLGWGNSLLGFIAMLMLPAPWLFIRYGEYLRHKFEIKNL